MRYIKTIPIVPILILLLQGCEQVFDPAVGSVQSLMVVEGSISTVPGVHKVSLSYTKPYNGNSKYPSLTGANVYVSDDQGKIIPFKEIGQGGSYMTDTNENIKAEIGRTYVLHIRTQSGDEFESLPQTIVKCAPIDSVFCEYDEQKVLEENINGDSYQVIYDGIRVVENTKGLYPNHNFYFFSFESYEQFRIGLQTTLGVEELYTHVPLPAKYYKSICTGNADEYSNQDLKHNRLLFIANNDLQRFTGTIPDSLLNGGNFVAYNIFQGLVFKLEQKSISDNAYLFWNSVQKQLEASGKLFDPVASQILGNIKCTSDPLKKACGVFYAYDVSVKYAWLYINEAGRIASSPLNGFPEISLDSLVENLPPAGWVRPSF